MELDYVNAAATAALRALKVSQENAAAAVKLLEEATADTEPAPISVVLVRDESNGRIHRRARIHGLPGLMSYESDNADRAGSFTIIPDLSQVSDDLDLCGRCFGEADYGAEGKE